jgi:hypothetical protein
MKTLKLAVCLMDKDDKIVSKTIIGTNWQVNTEHSLSEKYNLHVYDEIATILTESLKSQLTPEVIKEMLREIE